MNVYYLNVLEDYFNEQRNPNEVVKGIYKVIANYAKAVSSENLEEMQSDVAFLQMLAECFDAVTEAKE